MDAHSRRRRLARLRRSLPLARAGVLAPLALLASLFPPAAPAQVGSESVEVIVGPQYERSGLHRIFFGTNYRALWTEPIRVEALDMRREAGGLSPVRRVGGKQTRALALKGRDGRSYTFRGLEKDVSGLLDEELRGTIIEDLVRDQMSAQHPSSELVAGSITKSVGIPSQSWRLVVLPDDPALGEFREEFAGAVGVFGEYPTAPTADRPGTFGITEIIDHRELYRRLEAGTGDRLDDRALLRARLADIFMGDWDRHRRQWRWARFPGSPLWRPVPEDRDQAFSRYEGVVLGMVRRREPRFQNFGGEYGSMEGLGWNGRDQDRRLLVGLTRRDFEESASDLRDRLTDSRLMEAVEAMPPEWRRIDGARLLSDLRERRDRLDRAAVDYYRRLASRVDVTMTHRSDHVEVSHGDEGELTIVVRSAAAAESPREPVYRRVFRIGETEEVRLYALGGDDKVVVTGKRGGIGLRVVGGEGNDTLVVRGGGKGKLYDSSGENAAIGAALDARSYTPPPPPEDAPWVFPRDWGTESWSAPWVSYGPDLGLFLGVGVELRGFGFRKHPYAHRHLLRGGYALGARSGKVEYVGEFLGENRRSSWEIHAYSSGVEVLRFFGFGNETPDYDDADLTKAEASQHFLTVSFRAPMGRGASGSIGPVLKFLETDEAGTSLLGLTRPYGTGEFGQLGARAVLAYDSRDNRAYPRQGVELVGRGTLYPEAWSVRETFGEVNGNGALYAPIGAPLTLALRGGGKKVFGTYPFHEAAIIGGGVLGAAALEEPDNTVRGFRTQRFRGDASLWGNAELRLRVARVTLLLPAHWGLFGFSDVGRVWLRGEDSERWHSGAGGGLWLSFLSYQGTASAGLAHSREGDRFYFKGGFTF